MIKYDFFTLGNGLKVYVHQDKSTPTAVLNLLYNVGSRDEDEKKTGFAHLFEHLMFGGSKNIASFDEPLQMVGGENNAFTSPDLTNYYITLPSVNLETAFWLESDRMLSLSFDPKVLEVQRNVVIEEFKQRYLNQPYGDVWLKLRPLVYKKHSYSWPTIGKEISHIENATMEDVKSFFHKYYIPNNAILVIGGNVETTEVKKLAEKWFGPIPAGTPYNRTLVQEPEQKELRRMEVTAKVPLDALYMAYHMPDKLSKDYQVCDLMSDILGRGKSSRLYDKLVNGKKIFSSLNSHLSGSNDPGLIIIEGKLNQGIELKDAESEVLAVIEELKEKIVSESEITKVKNQAESTLQFGEVELLERCMAIAFAANLGDPEIVNKESEKIQAVTSTDINRAAKKYLKESNCTILYYRAEK
jgi:zinc protease